MTGPRIIFTHFADSMSTKLEAWRVHAARVVGAAAPQGPGRGEAVVWQLVSSNNRELGRSADVLSSFAAAQQHAELTASHANDLQVELVSHARAGMHGWYLRDGSGAVVTCARWFAAERERKYSIELALTSLAQVELGVGARQYIEHTATGAVEIADRLPRRDRVR